MKATERSDVSNVKLQESTQWGKFLCRAEQTPSSNQLLPNVLRDFLVQNSINLNNFSSASVDNFFLVILLTDAQADEKDVSTAGSKK